MFIFKLAFYYFFIRVRGLGYPERLISSLGAGACGVVGVGMFVVVSVVVSVSVVSAPLGGSPRGVARPTRPAGLPEKNVRFRNPRIC